MQQCTVAVGPALDGAVATAALPGRARRLRRADLVGAALFSGAAAWTLAAGRELGAGVSRTLMVMASALGAFVLGRALAAGGGLVLVAATVAAGGGGAVAVAGWSFVDSSGGAPLGYGNANGALFSLVTLATVLVAMATRRRPLRAAAIAAAILFLGATAATGSVVATTALVASVLVAAAGELADRRSRATVVGGSLVLAMIVVTVVLAAGHEPITRPETLVVRTRLWEEAIDLLRTEPVRGIGVGRFDEASSVSDDDDLSRAHSAFLQQGAEQGAVGLAFLLALWAWAMARCCVADRGSPAPAVGVAVLVSLGIHAAVDQVLSYAIVPVAAAALVGAVTARPRPGGPGPGTRG